MGDEEGFDIGGSIEGIGKGIGHALDGAGKFAERINGLTGGCFLPRKARKGIEAAKIKAEGAISVLESSGVELTERDRRTAAFFAMRDIRGFENIEETVALLDIPDGSHVSEIEDEWLSQFIDSASKAFSGWKRQMLADAASEKALHPSRISMDALMSIVKMEERHMIAFKKVCAMRPLVNGERSDPMILALDNDSLSIVDLSIRDLKSLQSIGLLREKNTRTRKIAVSSKYYIDEFGDERYELCSNTGEGKSLVAIIDFGDTSIKVPVVHILNYDLESFVSKKHNERFVDFGIMELTEPGDELASLMHTPTHQRMPEYIVAGTKVVQVFERTNNPNKGASERKYAEAIFKLIEKELIKQIKGF